jgi:hypothetical protein
VAQGAEEGLEAATAEIILEESRKRVKGAGLEAYLYAPVNANLKIMQEVLEMVEEGLPFDEWGGKNRLGKGHRVTETWVQGGSD